MSFKRSETYMPRQSIFDMKVSKVCPLLLQKVERKGRTQEELAKGKPLDKVLR
jgi:hypothetical protein